MSRLARVLLPVLVLACVALGVAWTVLDLGHVPIYGDTAEYLELAKGLRVDVYRGIAYPALLRAVDAVFPGRPLLEWTAGPSPAVAVVVQLLQLGACALALAYFVRVLILPVFAGPEVPRGVLRRGFLVLWLLLLFDPLIAHFSMALLTDALTFASTLVFCTALADFVLGVSRRRTSGALLVAATLLASGLRIEKTYVLVGTAVASAGWWYLRARGSAATVRELRSRAFEGSVWVAAAAITIMVLHGSVGGDKGRMPPDEMMAHMRVIFPHLRGVYDQLPGSVRARIRREDADRYDSHINEARKVIDDVSAGDTSLRRSMTWDMTGVVLRARWPAIAWDVLKDTIENVAAAPSFYTRLWGAGRMPGAPERWSWAARWTYTRLSSFEPVLSRWWLALSLVLMLVAMPFAVLRFLSRRSSASTGAWSAWLPLAACCVLNALIFALVSDFVHVRYVLVAHVATLGALYGGAWSWWIGSRGETRPPEA